MNIWYLIVGTIIVMGLGGGFFFFLWIVTRPKKMTWIAEVFQLTDGVQPLMRDKRKNIISDIRLSDLRPYTLDVLERVEKARGVVIYWLQKLKKVAPPVTANVVEYWGAKNKRIKVLLDGETVTLLKSGYDRKSGSVIFRPLPADRINLIKSEMAERTERIKEKKDILQSITPWVVTGVCMLSLVVISYFIGQAWIESSDANERAANDMSEAQVRAAEIMASALQGKPIALPEEIKQEKPPEVKG